MRKRQGLIIKVLLGWWLFCLAGQCLSLPLYKSLDAPAFMNMEGDPAGHHGCGGEQTLCDQVAFPAFFLLLAAALPLMLWLGRCRGRTRFSRSGSAFQALATGPPIYLLSQRFLE